MRVYGRQRSFFSACYQRVPVTHTSHAIHTLVVLPLFAPFLARLIVLLAIVPSRLSA